MPKYSVQAPAGWWAALVAVPIAAVTTVALIVAPPGDWSTLRPAQWMTIAGNALILESALAIVAAPVAGVAGGVWRIGIGTAIVVGTSAMLMLMLTGYSPDAVSRVAASHAALGATVIACATLGAFAKAFFSNDLDAAAVAIGVALVAAFGALTIGPNAGVVPTQWINAALAASPVVSTAAAADIDLLRSGALYRVSPIAHQQFDYPTWYATTTTYAFFSLAAWSVTTLRTRGSR